MLTIIVIILIIVISIYFLIVRPIIMRLGTTVEERIMKLPGDGLVVNPNQSYTQAITINAPASVVWAFLVQVGYKRAGWYNWDFINRLSSKNYFYENNKSSDRIIPELQNLKEHDQIYLTPVIPMDVYELKKNETMVLTGNKNGKYLVTWTYYLRELSADRTRLIVRWNSRLGEGFMFNLINKIIIEPGGAGIQQSLMLKGIKKRAEALAKYSRF
jgi:hypothetical protein